MPVIDGRDRPLTEKLIRSMPPRAVVLDLCPRHGGRLPLLIRDGDSDQRRVDVICDVTRTPFPADTFDLVTASGISENLNGIDSLIREMFRLVKPGGVVHLESEPSPTRASLARVIEPLVVHDITDPIIDRRLTVESLERRCAFHGLQVFDRGVQVGPTAIIVTLVARWLSVAFDGRQSWQRAFSERIFLSLKYLLRPLVALDALLIRKSGARRLSFGIYCTSRKAVRDRN